MGNRPLVLFILLAATTLSVTTLLYPIVPIGTSSDSFDLEDPNLNGEFTEPGINWNDINLVGSSVSESPEEETQIARSKMLRGFEAR